VKFESKKKKEEIEEILSESEQELEQESESESSSIEKEIVKVEEINKNINKYNNLLKNELKKIEKDEILKGIYKPRNEAEKKALELFNPCIKKIKEYKKNKNKKKRNPYKQAKYLLLTINPKECEIKDLKEIIKKIEKKEWIKINSYVYEQRGETEQEKGKGKHIHMIIEYEEIKKYYKKDKSPTHISQLLTMCLTKYIDNYKKIDIRKIYDDENKKKVEIYMQGIKEDKKLKSVEINKKWREENELKQIYIINGETEEIKREEIKETKMECILMEKGEKKYIKVKIGEKDHIVEIK